MQTSIVTLAGKADPGDAHRCRNHSLIAMHDVGPRGTRKNSRAGSVYIVKPKLHGPEEVAFRRRCFFPCREDSGTHAQYPENRHHGRRAPQPASICRSASAPHASAWRSSTPGFLDRTGDEIHTSMEAGVVPRKAELKKQFGWLPTSGKMSISASPCGLRGHAQIGKGMWAMPDLMADMLKSKVAHPQAGANTAWVPSPTAATLHALHYHEVDVVQVQTELAKRPRAALSEILTPPLVNKPAWSVAEVTEELNNTLKASSATSCAGLTQESDVPKCRISTMWRSWRIARLCAFPASMSPTELRHGICSKPQVMQALKDMARVVDKQNAGDPSYRPLAENPHGNLAFEAACDLIFEGREQPNGYTEAILTRPAHRNRRRTLDDRSPRSIASLTRSADSARRIRVAMRQCQI